jgi:hypothetical protein
MTFYSHQNFGRQNRCHCSVKEEGASVVAIFFVATIWWSYIVKTMHLYLKMRLLYLLVLLSAKIPSILAYANSGAPELNRRSMAGLWRLVTTNPKSLVATPRKEFTTYPKKFKELLLMLKEDGSFQQYNDDDNDEATSKTVKGTWDYLDGQLILATDRSTPSTFRDTILVGTVVAKSQNSLPDNPLTKKEELVNATQAAGSNTDTHLSVPQGSVKVGKFMYPKHHP